MISFVYDSMIMIEVILTDEALAWLRDLPRVHQAQVGKALDKLEIVGVALGHPASSAVKGASFALRELRVHSGGHALRVFYSFDPVRNAVVLMGGDKTGVNSDDFYTSLMTICERIWAQYLAEHARGEHDE